MDKDKEQLEGTDENLQEEFTDDELDELLAEDEQSTQEETQEEKDWKSEAAKWRAIALKNKKRLEKKSEPQEKVVETKNDTGDEKERLDKLEMKVNHPELTPEQIDFVFAYAKGKGISPSSAMESDFVKKAFQADKEEEEIANATPSSETRSSVQKTEPKKKMSPEEHMKYAMEKAKEIVL